MISSSCRSLRNYGCCRKLSGILVLFWLLSQKQKTEHKYLRVKSLWITVQEMCVSRPRWCAAFSRENAKTRKRAAKRENAKPRKRENRENAKTGSKTRKRENAKIAKTAKTRKRARKYKSAKVGQLWSSPDLAARQCQIIILRCNSGVDLCCTGTSSTE